MDRLDRPLEDLMLAWERRIGRRDLFKGATATILALGALSNASRASATICSSNWGRCDGALCCNSYGGCGGSSKCTTNLPADCYTTTGSWSRCCSDGWRYTWVDCCFRKINNNLPCSGGCVRGPFLGCAQSYTCQDPNCYPNCLGCVSYCGSGYCCTYRVLTQAC